MGLLFLLKIVQDLHVFGALEIIAHREDVICECQFIFSINSCVCVVADGDKELDLSDSVQRSLVVMSAEVLILDYRAEPWRPLTKLMFYYETMNGMVFLINNALRFQ